MAATEGEGATDSFRDEWGEPSISMASALGMWGSKMATWNRACRATLGHLTYGAPYDRWEQAAALCQDASSLELPVATRGWLVAPCQDIQTVGCAPADPSHSRAEPDCGRAVPSARPNSWADQRSTSLQVPGYQRTLYPAAAADCRVQSHCHHCVHATATTAKVTCWNTHWLGLPKAGSTIFLQSPKTKPSSNNSFNYGA